MNAPGKTAAKAFSDRRDRLVSAEEPLASLQFNCGGTIPGTIAIPSLLESVRKAREYGLKIARTMQAQDDHEAITAWIELTPLEDGCEICVRNWQAMPFEADGDASGEGAPHAADRALADFTAILDAEQNTVAAESEARDLTPLLKSMARAQGERWSKFVRIEGLDDRAKLHWRLLDGAQCMVEGSERKWTIGLYPRRTPVGDLAGFELTLTADRPLDRSVRAGDDPEGRARLALPIAGVDQHEAAFWILELPAPLRLRGLQLLHLLLVCIAVGLAHTPPLGSTVRNWPKPSSSSNGFGRPRAAATQRTTPRCVMARICPSILAESSRYPRTRSAICATLSPPCGRAPSISSAHSSIS